ncbi:MAG: tetratricopeptide repeat protein [Planctomycetes bacterium]|nr:tetratricopeptide repeat protein [Planctomycetota bacterium]
MSDGLRPESVVNVCRFLGGHLLLGQLAIQSGYITEQQLAEALREQGASPERRPLAAVLLERRALTSKQVAELLLLQKRLEGDRGPSDGVAQSLGRYILHEKLGEGGAGVVWRAWDTQLQRWVAIKEPRPGAGLPRERFLREARAAAKVRHPNLIEVHEIGEESGRDYLVMTYIDGRSLDTMRLDPLRVAALMADICDAVHHMHANGLLHRDIKPQNILVDANGKGYLGDFGLAKDVSSHPLTLEGRLLGTPVYMAPEQASGKSAAIAPHTDVYGLGATLYHAAIRRPPFENAGDMATLFQKLTSEAPAPPRRYDPALPAELEAIILHAMEKHPEDRYPNAAAMAEDLRRFLRGDPVSARPLGPVRRSLRWVARNRILTGAFALAALGLLGGTAVAGWHLSQSSRRRAFDRTYHDGVDLWIEARRGSAFNAIWMTSKAEEARQRFEEASLILPDHPLPWLMRGRCLLLLRRGPEAERCLTKAVELDPKLGAALLERGKYYVGIYVHQRRPPPVRLVDGRARTGRPPPESEEERLLRARSERDILDARAAGGADALELRAIEGIIAFGSGDYARAVPNLDDWARANPWDFSAAGLLASAAYLAGDPTRAEDAWTRALQLDPKPERYRARGDARLCLGDFAAAIEDYDRAEEDPEALCNRGLALQALGRPSDAIESYSRAIARNPRMPRAYNNRGIARFDQLDLEGARADFDQATEIDEFYAEAHYNLGNVWMASRHYAEAERAYTAAMERDEHLVDAYVNRARARLKMERSDEAHADLDEALRRRPDDPDILFEAAITLSDAETPDLLRRALENALPNWPRREQAEQILREHP